MARARKKQRPPAPCRFGPGDRVRVRHGVVDPDHPDMPLGGWAGTIAEVHSNGVFTVRWTKETLRAIHPVYRKRCLRDGMCLEEYWLEDGDLVPDPGGPLAIEQPARITPRPLSPTDQEDRVRMVFGLTSDDLLPGPGDETLDTYYDYLDERLAFPFDARCSEEEEGFLERSAVRRVKVVGLDRELYWDDDEGILCRVRTSGGEDAVPLSGLGLRRSDPNRQLVDDYAAWFAGELTYEDDVEDGEPDDEYDEDAVEEDSFAVAAQPRRATWLKAAEFIAFAACCGAVIGAAVAVMPWARWAACIGAGLGGVFEAAVLAASASRGPSPGRTGVRFERTLAAVAGLTGGAAWGAIYGVMAVALAGVVLGAIAGLAMRRLLRREVRFGLGLFPGVVFCAAACGAVAQAFYVDFAGAAQGLWHGALTGLGGVLVLCLATVSLAFVLNRPRRQAQPS